MPLLQKINAFLDRRSTGVGLLLLLATVYVFAHQLHPLFPGNKPDHPAGWWEWSDQGLYLKSAASLARGSLDPTQHHFPLGYPALGAPFARWMPADPFFIPDLLLVVGSAFFLWQIGRRLLSPLPLLFFFACFVVSHASLLSKTNVIPWNTLATQCALLAGVFTALQPACFRNTLLLSLTAGFTCFVRPADCLPFAPLLVFSVLRLSSWKERLLAAAGGLAVVSAAIAATCALNAVVYGQLHSPYETYSLGQIGFFSYPEAEKLFVLLVDPHAFFLEKTPGLFFRYPWLFLAPAGIVFWIHKEGAGAVAAVLAVAASWILYLNYNDFLPSDVYRYNLIHYLSWSFPLLALLAFSAVINGVRLPAVRVAAGAGILLAVLCLGLRLDGIPLAPPAQTATGWSIPARRSLYVRFPGEPSSRQTTLVIDGHPQLEYRQYLTAEFPRDLRLWLGPRAQGTVLSCTGVSAQPELSVPAWNWRPGTDRLAMFLR